MVLRRTMLLVTNTPAFPLTWTAAGGVSGRSAIARSFWECVAYCRNAETVYVIDCDPGLVVRLSALFLVFPFLRRPLVAVDLVLRRPEGPLQRISLCAKRYLFSRIDHFVHYFRDLQGYQAVFGIGPDRSSFVPFKPNVRYRREVEPNPDGDYVLCLGRSMRDYATFFQAMALLPFPAAIASPDLSSLKAHGARFALDLDQLPSAVRVLDDDGTEDNLVRVLSGARLVVLPILKSNIAASGISTALNAMLLGKCVIASEGPGISDVFSSEVLTVPPEDPATLAEMIRRAWIDGELRSRTAAAGRRCALSFGGEPELYQRIIDKVVSWYLGTHDNHLSRRIL